MGNGALIFAGKAYDMHFDYDRCVQFKVYNHVLIFLTVGLFYLERYEAIRELVYTFSLT